jgi:hypothetical protein
MVHRNEKCSLERGPGTAFPIICSARPAAATTGSALADGSYVKQMVIGTLLGSRSRW